MLFLPECSGFMGSSSEQTLENAETIPNHPEPPLRRDINDNSTKTLSKWHRSLEETVCASFTDGVRGGDDPARGRPPPPPQPNRSRNR